MDERTGLDNKFQKVIPVFLECSVDSAAFMPSLLLRRFGKTQNSNSAEVSPSLPVQPGGCTTMQLSLRVVGISSYPLHHKKSQAKNQDTKTSGGRSPGCHTYHAIFLDLFTKSTTYPG